MISRNFTAKNRHKAKFLLEYSLPLPWNCQ